MQGAARIVAEAPEGFELYSGDDALTLPLLSVGAVGAVSVAGNWAGVETADIIAAWFKGDADGARVANARLFESYDFESSEAFPNPLPAKAACRVLGLPAGQCRLPLGAAPPSSRTGPARCSRTSGATCTPLPVHAQAGRLPESVRIIFLGGLGEIGRNCACFELGGRIVVLDCGIMFPEPDMPGIDLVLPDLSYLRDHADAVEAVVLTHGHEDHTGGLAFLLRDLSVPVYGSALTLGLARNRVEEAGLADRARFIEVIDGERRQIGPFEVEFIPVTHSVPHGFATAFHTPQGVILHSGDFKIDLTPVDGRLTDLARIGTLAAGPGIRLLLSDSTNAEEPGFTDSESQVGATHAAAVRGSRRTTPHRDLLRQPHPPGAAGRRRRPRPRGGRWPRSGGPWPRTSSWPGGSACSSSPRSMSSTSSTSTTWTRARCASCPRAPRVSRCRRCR